MHFSHSTIIQVQATWREVEQIAPEAARLFYANLFDLAPHLRPLFRGDMTAQGEKLMHMIGAAVSKLHKPEALTHVLQALGERHQGYGVRDEHYALVGTALLLTLDQGLGSRFTPLVRHAWTEVYFALARAMMQAARTFDALEAA